MILGYILMGLFGLAMGMMVGYRFGYDMARHKTTAVVLETPDRDPRKDT